MSRFRLISILLILVAVGFLSSCSCGDDDDSSDDAVPDDTSDDTVADDTQPDDSAPDDTGDDTEDELPPYLISHPELLDWSTWSARFDHADPPRVRMLGGFGTGNGHAFALLANNSPLTTLHNISGPNYQRYDRWFSDKVFTLAKEGEPVAWDLERAWRVRDTDIILIRQDAGDLSLWTIDFAPQGDGLDDSKAMDALVRIILVHNRGNEIVTGLSLRARTVVGQVKEGRIYESNFSDERRLVAGFPDAASVGDEGFVIGTDLADIAAGDNSVTVFLTAFAKPGDPTEAFDAAAAYDVEDLLSKTLDSWKSFMDEGARVTTDNVRFNDIIEAQDVIIKTQQAYLGGVAQMGEYSNTWARDIMGPARFYSIINRSDEYKRMIDYYWTGVLDRGNISNSFPLDIELDTIPDQPDWESLPVGSGRTAAEGPSYVVLHYKAWLDATGDWTPLEERYGMLRHAVIHQALRDGCLLPFSGDETYRIIMGVGFGQWITDEYADTDLSANSSFLLVAAAEFMVGVAEHFGYTADATEYQTLADAVRACTEEYYWLPSEGFYSPIIDIDTLQPTHRPYEDVNTVPLWVNYLSADDPQAQENMVNTMAALSNRDGLFYTPRHILYALLLKLADIELGVVTGMTYGYFLDSLAQIDHPQAEETFLVFDEFFHDSGTVSEAMAVDDFGRLMYLQEPLGFVCDLTAKYRSWEGGINAAAMIRYLFGLVPDAVGSKISLAPHLPEGWGYAEMTNAKVGDVGFDLRVEDSGATRTLYVKNATGALEVDAVVSLDVPVQGVTVNGSPATADMEMRFGRYRAKLTGLSVDSGSDLVINVIYGENRK